MIYFLLVVPVFMFLLLAVMKSAKSADDQIEQMLAEEGIRRSGRRIFRPKGARALSPQVIPITKHRIR